MSNSKAVLLLDNVQFISVLFFFDAILNRIVFLIFFSDSSLLIYRNETNFVCQFYIL